MTLAETAAELRRLHTDPELLQVVNVWDVVSAKAVAALPQTRAIATASHSIAATFGYPDGEQIPVELMLDMCGRIARAVDVPVSADLEAGYGDPGETIRRAIGEGIAGANLEDQLKPLADSVAAVEAAVAAGDAEGVPFALNARTDAFLRGRDRCARRERRRCDRARARLPRRGRHLRVRARQLRRGCRRRTRRRARRAAGQRSSGSPTCRRPTRLQELGVARLSYGPYSQRVVLAELQDLASDLVRRGRAAQRHPPAQLSAHSANPPPDGCPAHRSAR